MKATTLVRLAAKSIMRHKLRTFLTMLGIVIGVAAVIVMVAIGYGAQSSIEKQIQDLGTNLIMITPGSTGQRGVSMGSGSLNRLSLEDVEKIKREAQFIDGISPIVSSASQVIAREGNWRTRIEGVAESYQHIRNLQFTAGSWFGEDDVRSMNKVAVLGATVVKALFPDGNAIGQEIRVRNVPFTVIGVLASKGQTTGMDRDDIIMMPYTTAQVRLKGRSFLSQIVASAISQQDMLTAQEEIRTLLRESHRLTDTAKDDFTIGNQNDLADAMTQTTQIMTWLLAAIASISLLVGGIGIMNIMLVSVTERTREIGIRMAVGARGADVMVQFLVESVVMSVFGGCIGIAVGILSAVLVGMFTGWNTVTPPQAIVLAVGFSAAIGIFFGFYPARQAAALNPIQALRYE